MQSVSLSEAKDRLSEFVAAVEHGDEIVITRHGKPKAKLVAIDDRDARMQRQRAALESIRAFRASRAPTGITLDEIVAWVREDRDG